MRTVQQVLNGECQETLTRVLDLNPATIYKWLNRYHYGVQDTLKANPIPGRPPEIERQTDGMSDQDNPGKEPLAAQFSICLVDVVDDPAIDPRTFQFLPERGLGGVDCEDSGFQSSTSAAPCHSAGSGFGRALAKEGISENPDQGRAGKFLDFLCG